MSNELHHMYQAWQQGNDRYLSDWYDFALWAARLNGTTVEKILSDLEKCLWFKKGN